MTDESERPLTRLERVRLDGAKHLAAPESSFAFAVVGPSGFAARRNDERRVIDNRGRDRAPSTEE